MLGSRMWLFDIVSGSRKNIFAMTTKISGHMRQPPSCKSDQAGIVRCDGGCQQVFAKACGSVIMPDVSLVKQVGCLSSLGSFFCDRNVSEVRTHRTPGSINRVPLHCDPEQIVRR